MRRSTSLVKAVDGAIAELGGADTRNANNMLATLMSVQSGLQAALAAYRQRPDGEAEVRKAKAKAKAA